MSKDSKSTATDAASNPSARADHLAPQPGRAPSARFLKAGGSKPKPKDDPLDGAQLGDLVKLTPTNDKVPLLGVGSKAITDGQSTRLSPIHVTHARNGLLAIKRLRSVPAPTFGAAG